MDKQRLYIKTKIDLKAFLKMVRRLAGGKYLMVMAAILKENFEKIGLTEKEK